MTKGILLHSMLALCDLCYGIKSNQIKKEFI